MKKRFEVGSLTVVVADDPDKQTQKELKVLKKPNKDNFMESMSSASEWPGYNNCLGIFWMDNFQNCHLPLDLVIPDGGGPDNSLDFYRESYGSGKTREYWQGESGSIEGGNKYNIPSGEKIPGNLVGAANIELVEHWTGNTVILESIERETQNLYDQGLLSPSDSRWIKEETSKINRDLNPTERELTDFMTFGFRLWTRILTREISNQEEGTEFFIIGGNTTNQVGWKDYHRGVNHLRRLVQSCTGNEPIILSPPDKGGNKNYTFDVRNRIVYVTGMQDVMHLPFGVSSEKAVESYPKSEIGLRKKDSQLIQNR